MSCNVHEYVPKLKRRLTFQFLYYSITISGKSRQTLMLQTPGKLSRSKTTRLWPQIPSTPNVILNISKLPFNSVNSEVFDSVNQFWKFHHFLIYNKGWSRPIKMAAGRARGRGPGEISINLPKLNLCKGSMFWNWVSNPSRRPVRDLQSPSVFSVFLSLETTEVPKRGFKRKDGTKNIKIRKIRLDFEGLSRVSWMG